MSLRYLCVVLFSLLAVPAKANPISRRGFIGQTACTLLLSPRAALELPTSPVGFNALRRMVRTYSGETPELKGAWEVVRRYLAAQTVAKGGLAAPFRYDFTSLDGKQLSLLAKLEVEYDGWIQARYDGVYVPERAVVSVNYSQAKFELTQRVRPLEE